MYMSFGKLPEAYYEVFRPLRRWRKRDLAVDQGDWCVRESLKAGEVHEPLWSTPGHASQSLGSQALQGKLTKNSATAVEPTNRILSFADHRRKYLAHTTTPLAPPDHHPTAVISASPTLSEQRW